MPADRMAKTEIAEIGIKIATGRMDEVAPAAIATTTVIGSVTGETVMMTAAAGEGTGSIKEDKRAILGVYEGEPLRVHPYGYESE